MAITTYNCDALTGGGSRALDSHQVSVLVDKDRAICAVSGDFLYFMYNAAGTAAENVTTHPYVVRPDDYTTAGNWEEQEVGAGVSDTAYAGSWDGVTTIGASKNAIYDEMETKADKGVNADITSMTGLDNDGIPVAKVSGAIETATLAAIVIADNKLVRGDGGVRGVQESTIVIDDSGRMINPSQPCFQVKPTSDQTNLPTSPTVTTIVFDSERFDVGNNFASNAFTAPITGKYLFSYVLWIAQVDTAATYYQFQLNTSNLSYILSLFTPSFTADLPFWSVGGSLVVDMDINDTASLEYYQVAGSAQTDIKASSYFSGALIC